MSTVQIILKLNVCIEPIVSTGFDLRAVLVLLCLGLAQTEEITQLTFFLLVGGNWKTLRENRQTTYEKGHTPVYIWTQGFLAVITNQ